MHNGGRSSVAKADIAVLLALGAAFFIAIAMTNFTFILYTLSDPFG